MTIRVLVADDQALVRAGIRMLVETQPDLEVTGEAADGMAAVSEVTRSRPDVVLMDIRMPRLDGIEAARRIVALGPGSAKVVMLTTFDLDEYVFDALNAGATGFLLKHARPEELLFGIRAAADGHALIAPALTRRLIERFACSRPRAAPELGRLTEREREVLIPLIRGRSNAEIARDLFVGESTVKTHVARIFTKLGLRDRAQAVIYGYETGLVTPGGQSLAGRSSVTRACRPVRSAYWYAGTGRGGCPGSVLHSARLPARGCGYEFGIPRACLGPWGENDALGRAGGVGPGLFNVGERSGPRVDVEGSVRDLLGECGQFGEDFAGADGALSAADDLEASRAERG